MAYQKGEQVEPGVWRPAGTEAGAKAMEGEMVKLAIRRGAD